MVDKIRSVVDPKLQILFQQHNQCHIGLLRFHQRLVDNISQSRSQHKALDIETELHLATRGVIAMTQLHLKFDEIMVRLRDEFRKINNIQQLFG